MFNKTFNFLSDIFGIEVKEKEKKKLVHVKLLTAFLSTVNFWMTTVKFQIFYILINFKSCFTSISYDILYKKNSEHKCFWSVKKKKNRSFTEYQPFCNY